ncbi:MAG: hypothetical protein ACK4NX_03375, partial [Candidatus Paceibacteria bacterium]
MYTTLRRALKNTENTEDVIEFIANYVGVGAEIELVRQILLPLIQQPRPCIALGRHIATANFESILLTELAEETGATPVWLTYPQDQFFSGNPDKVGLLQGYIYLGVGKKGGPRLHKFVLATEPPVPCGPLEEIFVRDSANKDRLLSLPEFHAEWRRRVGLPTVVNTVDLGRIFHQLAGLAGKEKVRKEWYYPIYLALT